MRWRCAMAPGWFGAGGVPIASARLTGCMSARAVGKGPLWAHRSLHSNLQLLLRHLRRGLQRGRRSRLSDRPRMRRKSPSSVPNSSLRKGLTRSSRKGTGLRRLGCYKQRLKWRARELDSNGNKRSASIGGRIFWDNPAVGFPNNGPKVAVASSLGRDPQTTRRFGRRRFRSLRSLKQSRWLVEGAGRHLG